MKPYGVRVIEHPGSLSDLETANPRSPFRSRARKATIRRYWKRKARRKGKTEAES